MIKRAAVVSFAVAAVLVPGVASAADSALHFTLTSPAFADDGVLPLKYAGGAQCGGGGQGGDVSPPLTWADPPAGTKSFAVLMIDPDGRRGLGSVHWVAYGVPAASAGIKEGEGSTPSSAIVEGENSRGTMGYTGPCGPSVDAPHHYVIDVIALDLEPGVLQPGLDRDQLLKAIVGHSLGPASLVVRYHHQP